MRCENCGTLLDQNINFCPMCGNDLRLIAGRDSIEDDMLAAVLRSGQEGKRGEAGAKQEQDLPEEDPFADDVWAAVGMNRRQRKSYNSRISQVDSPGREKSAARAGSGSGRTGSGRAGTGRSRSQRSGSEGFAFGRLGAEKSGSARNGSQRSASGRHASGRSAGQRSSSPRSGSRIGAAAAGGRSGPSRRESDARRRTKRKILTTIIAVIVLIIVAVVIVTHARNHSESYLYDQANKSYLAHDYSEATGYLDQLLEVNPDNTDAMLLMAKICLSTKDYSRGEEMVQKFLKAKADSREGYRTLLQIYDAQGRYDDILSLSQTVTDADILSVFDEFLTPSPVATPKGGSYQQSMEITFQTTDAGTIYYTLDGTSPTDQSAVYSLSEPIELTEEGETVLTAVCIDSKGHKSRVVQESYQLTFPEAEKAEVSPAGGEFESQTWINITPPEGSTAYYEWDYFPDLRYDEYTGAFRVKEGNHVLYVVTVNEYGKESEAEKYNFVYYPPAPAEPVYTGDPDVDTDDVTEIDSAVQNNENDGDTE